MQKCLEPFLIKNGDNKMEHCPDLPEISRQHNLPDELDKAGTYADKRIQQLKALSPKLAWLELEDILEPEKITDVVMDHAKTEDETFTHIVNRVGQMALTAELILLYENTVIVEYYMSQYLGD
jgi:hypothetical protein